MSLEAIDRERALRRHPAVRRTSRWSGFLLLAMLAHAAFGYALLGPGIGHAWVQTTHRLGAALVVFLATLTLRAAHDLPSRSVRERFLIGLTWLVVLLITLQLVIGLAWFAELLARGGDLALVHVGSGITATLLAAVLHTTAILPSILLAARREHLALTEERGLRP
jgi:hypothetical protein